MTDMACAWSNWAMRAVCLLLALLLGGAATAHAADNKAVAKSAYQEGQRFFELGEYGKALDAFKRAYVAYDDPAFLFNLGQCYRMLGDKAEAVRSYKQYLRKLPNGPMRDSVERLVSDLEAAIEKDRAARTRPPEGVQAPGTGQGPGATAPPPTPAETQPQPTVVAASPAVQQEAPPRRPLVKKPWFWAVVGGAALVVAGVAIGVGVGASPKDPRPSIASVPGN